jgi:ubiquinone/menaquinone biosynthesis C-methylase UbiE
VSKLSLKPGDRLLYTSIGTGQDLPYFAEQVFLEELELVGLDLSMGMLRRCQARIRPYPETSVLLQANAERLPLANQSFDVVLHVGGINFFDQPAVAVKEMLRVAKAGVIILIADETKDVVKNNYQRNPFTRAYFKDASTNFSPRDWVPPGVSDPTYEELWNGKMYILTFKAPVH